MIDMYEAGTLSACPNEHCYTAVINSCKFAIGYVLWLISYIPRFNTHSFSLLSTIATL
jgi:hypothetical protein